MSARGFALALCTVIALIVGPSVYADEPAESSQPKDESASAASPGRTGDADSKDPPAIGKPGAVQEAMHQLYVVPRKRGTGPVGSGARTVAGNGDPARKARKSANGRSSSNGPTNEELRKAFPDAGATSRPAFESERMIYGSYPYPFPYPYYYEPGGGQLSRHDRDFSNYRYFGGQPGRYGYGNQELEYELDDGYGGDFYRFGFNRGFDYGYFTERSNARTESNLQHFATHLTRGLDFFRNGRYREAADAFRLAADTHQGDPSAKIYAAHALFAVGRYQEAVPYLRRAFELQPNIALLSFDIRDDYKQRSDFDQQLSTLQEAVQHAPANMDRLIVLGYVLYFTGHRDDAYPVLVSAWKLDRRSALVKLLLDNSRPSDLTLEQTRSQK